MAILEGKVIVVTGAGRGIGKQIALLAAREGGKIVVNDIGASLGGEGRDQTPAEEVVSQIKKEGGEAVASYDSVAEWDSAPLRHSSLIGIPASACLRKPMICSSLYLLFFMSVILHDLTDFSTLD